MTVSLWSTTAATFRVDPDDSGLIVTHRADYNCYIFIFTIISTGVLTNGDIEVSLQGKRRRDSHKIVYRSPVHYKSNTETNGTNNHAS